jgi:hypothetical protein
MWEDLCFWAQQAAELAIKAIYQRHGWLFPLNESGLTEPTQPVPRVGGRSVRLVCA